MSELSDIQLRIRVEVVAAASLLALVGGMNSVNAAAKRTRSSTKSLVGSFSTLGDGLTRTTAAATRQRQVNAGLAKGQTTLNSTTVKLGESSKTNTALNARLARGVQILTARSVAIGASSKSNIALNARLARGVQILTTRTVATSSATKRADKVNRDLASGVRTLTAASERNAKASVAAANAKNKMSQASIRAGLAAQRLLAEEKKLNSLNAKLGRGFERIVGHLSSVERKLDAVFRAGVHLQSMGRDLLGFGRKIIGALRQAADAWGDFEFNLNRASGAMDVFDNKSKMYDDLKDSVIAMARELRLVPASEAAKAMYFWQSTTGESIDTAQKLAIAINGVKTAMKVAILTQTGYEQVIKGAYSIMRQYRLELTDIPQILKDLWIITMRTSLEYEDLIQAFKYTGPIAKMLGADYKDVAKWLGIIGDLGQRGSLSGRGLGMMFTQIVRPTAKAKKAYNSLFAATLKVKNGYNKLVFPKGKFIGFEKWVTLLAKSTTKLTQQQKLQYLTTILGTQNAARIVLPLIDAQNVALGKGVSIFNESKYSMANSAKLFDEAWGLLEKSWQGTIGLLEQSVMPILLTVGEHVAKVLTPVFNDLSEALWDARGTFEEVAKSVSEAFQPAIEQVGKLMTDAIKWFKENPEIAKQIMQWVAMASIIAVVSGVILLAVGTFIFLFSSIVLIVAGMLPMLALFAAGAVTIAAFASAVYRNVGGIQEAFAKFAASVGRVLTIFIGGSEDASISVGTLAEQFGKLVDSVTSSLATALNAISDALDRLTPEDIERIKQFGVMLAKLWVANRMLGILTGVIKGLTGNILGLARSMVSAAPTIIKFLGHFSPSNIAGAIKGIKEFGIAVSGTLKTVGAALKANPIMLVIMAIVVAIGLLVAAYETNFMGFRDFVNGLVAWFQTNVIPVIAGLFQWLQDIVPPALQVIADFVNNVLMPVFNELVAWIVETFGPVLGQMGDTLVAIGNFFALLGVKIGEAVGVIAEWLSSLGINFDVTFGEAQITVESVLGVILTIIGAFVTLFMNVAGPWMDGLLATVKTIFEGIAGFISGVFRFIEGIFQIFSAVLSGDWDLFFKGIGNVVGGFVDTVVAFFETLFKLVEGVLATGVSIILGVFKTIFGEGEGSVYSNIKGFIDTITKFAGDVIGGFVKGIQDAVAWAIEKVSGAVGAIIDGIKSFLGISSPATMMLDIGKSIVQGLWKGINDAKDWIIGKVTAFINSIIPGPIKDALGIKSPSKVMATIGENVVKGLAVGIERTDDALKAINGVISDINTAASSAAVSFGSEFNSRQSVDATRKIELEVNVTSADGSINSMDMNTLAGLITGSEMARSLERMASVD